MENNSKNIELKNSDIISIGKNTPDNTESFFDFADKLKVPENGIFRENCKLCHSDFRKEAESLYEKGTNFINILKFLKDNNQDISMNAVRNHLKFHYGQIEKIERFKEYTKSLKEWNSIRESREEKIRTQMSILEQRIHSIAAFLDDSEKNQDDYRKNTDLLIKAQNQLLLYQKQLDEYSAEIKPVYLLIETIKNIIKDKLQNTDSKDVKIAFQGFLSDLSIRAEEFIDIREI